MMCAKFFGILVEGGGVPPEVSGDLKTPGTVPFKMRIAPIGVKTSDKTISISRILIAGTLRGLD